MKKRKRLEGGYSHPASTDVIFGGCGRSMMTTYNLYIPGPYENFAEQATEVWNGMMDRWVALDKNKILTLKMSCWRLANGL